MKHALALTVFLLTKSLHATVEEKPVIVQCGKDTVVLQGYDSPDKRYALGWTIRATGQNSQPVDWSKLREGNPKLFWDDYLDEFKKTEESGYVGVLGLLDLLSKTFKDLPDSEPYFASRRSVHQLWVDAITAFIKIDSRFEIERFYMLKTGKNGISCMDLTATMDQKVGKLAVQKRPLTPDMSILCDLDNAVVRKGIIRIPISLWIPKGSSEDFDGQLHISLKAGSVLDAVSDVSADRPFVGELGEADSRLNEVYRNLRKALEGIELGSLVSEQRTWLTDRNNEIEQFARFPNGELDEGDLLSYRKARNQKALQLTQDRTEVLQKQLEASKAR